MQLCAASMFVIIIIYLVCAAEETRDGINGLLDFHLERATSNYRIKNYTLQIYLMNAHWRLVSGERHIWKYIEDQKKQIFQLVGKGINFAVREVALVYFVSFLMIPFNLDPTYFIFDVILPAGEKNIYFWLSYVFRIQNKYFAMLI